MRLQVAFLVFALIALAARISFADVVEIDFNLSENGVGEGFSNQFTDSSDSDFPFDTYIENEFRFEVLTTGTDGNRVGFGPDNSLEGGIGPGLDNPNALLLPIGSDLGGAPDNNGGTLTIRLSRPDGVYFTLIELGYGDFESIAETGTISVSSPKTNSPVVLSDPGVDPPTSTTFGADFEEVAWVDFTLTEGTGSGTGSAVLTSLNVAAVPEPFAVALLPVCAVSAFAANRRRKRLRIQSERAVAR